MTWRSIQKYDIRIDGQGVHPDQGNPIIGAGNTFSGVSFVTGNSIVDAHIQMNASTAMDYYREEYR